MKRPAFLFYPKDWLSDINLQTCSLSAQAIWIKLMCLMHLSDDYGKILLKQLLKQNFNQNPKECWSKSVQLATLCGATIQIFEPLFIELFDAGLIEFDETGNIASNRMILDHQISIERSKAGKKGGKNTAKKFNKTFQTKFAQANLVDANEDVNETENLNNEYQELIQFLNKLSNSSFRGDEKSKKQFNQRINEGYKLEDLKKAITNCFNTNFHKINPHFLTPSFITKDDKLQQYLNFKSIETNTPLSNEATKEELLADNGFQ